MKLKKWFTVQWTPKRLFFAAAVGLYVLLAMLPASRYIVRGQINHLGAYCQTAFDPWQKNHREKNIAEAVRYPNNFQMQFAAALQHLEEPVRNDTAISRRRAARLWALRTRFSNEPALYAAVIRYLTGAGVRTGRDAEQDLLATPTARAESAVARAKLARKMRMTPESDAAGAYLNAWYTQAAKEGERSDPQNGFFPMMQAVTFFESNQDAEGLAALRRAAQKPRWDDYASEEARACDKLTQATHGETGMLARTSRYSAIRYPHLAQYRATTRVAISLAVRKELAGDIDGGMAIRRDVARCGAFMRVESSSYVGSLVGMAITQVATTRPGGTEVPETLQRDKGIDKARLRTEQFLDYANKIGQSDAAAFFQAEGIARENARAVHRAVEGDYVFSVSRLTKMMALWSGGSALIPNALVVLVLGGVAFGLARTPRVRSGKPLHPAVRWGLAALALPVPFAFIGLHCLEGVDGLIVGYVAAFLSVSGAAVAVLRDCRGGGRNVLIFVTTLTSVAASLGIVILGSVPAFQMAKEMADLLGLREFGVVPAFDMLLGASNLNGALPGMIWVLLPKFGGVVFFGAGVGSLAILARCRRVPVSVGIVRGAAGGALTVASVLLFAYAALTLVTLRAEQGGATGAGGT